MLRNRRKRPHFPVMQEADVARALARDDAEHLDAVRPHE
jgi:hypothetical protein